MIEHKGTQVIKTERLLLRKILPADATMVFRWMSDPQVCKYERWESHHSVDYTRGYINEALRYSSDQIYQWGVVFEESLIGLISIVNINDHDRKATLGYCLARDYWSKGYTSEAVKAVIKFMLVDVGLNRIEASCSVNNIASFRVLEKVGMTYEGQATEYYFCNVGFQDSNLYAITKSSYYNHTDNVNVEE